MSASVAVQPQTSNIINNKHYHLVARCERWFFISEKSFELQKELIYNIGECYISGSYQTTKSIILSSERMGKNMEIEKLIPEHLIKSIKYSSLIKDGESSLSILGRKFLFAYVKGDRNFVLSGEITGAGSNTKEGAWSITFITNAHFEDPDLGRLVIVLHCDIWCARINNHSSEVPWLFIESAYFGII